MLIGWRDQHQLWAPRHAQVRVSQEYNALKYSDLTAVAVPSSGSGRLVSSHGAVSMGH